ncbi:uncharacterized protein LOC125721183 [Brienomyrus brachyistius]|uniref:uncharacterized protein LOC125721183 n=1 Tax=Brienomyrus brachyistius TaxID=42636 RepID=UPI0020B2F079|nr:uncharacterized protein LOC125721183 [Brienomyrus brachyistius]
MEMTNWSPSKPREAEDWNSDKDADLLSTPTVIFRDNREGTVHGQHKRKRTDSFNDTADDELLIAAAEKIEAGLATAETSTGGAQSEPEEQLESTPPCTPTTGVVTPDQGFPASGDPATTSRALSGPLQRTQDWDIDQLTPWQWPVASSLDGAVSRAERLKGLKVDSVLCHRLLRRIHSQQK